MQTRLLRPAEAVRFASVLALAVLALAGCGGGASSPSDPPPTPSNTPSGGASAFAAYTSCLRKHGVQLPTFRGSSNGGAPPSSPPSGSPPQNGGDNLGGNLTPAQRKAFETAQKACASLRPQGGPFGGGGGGSAP
jgi:hypothetical protein